MKDKTEVKGDWMVALETGHRIVVWFYKRDGEQVVEVIYDKHIWNTESTRMSRAPRQQGTSSTILMTNGKKRNI